MTILPEETTAEDRRELRYGLLEGYYLADAFFAGSDEGDGILELIDDALCSDDPAAMREALPLVAAAMLPQNADEKERAAEARAGWRYRWAKPKMEPQPAS
jgi:hypothetical protein